MTKKLLLFFIVLIISTPSIAQLPQIDNTFGTSGPGYTEFNPNLLFANTIINASAATPDGSIVVTGQAEYTNDYNHFIVAKLNDSGYDTTFGSNGITLPVFQATNWSINGQGKDIAVQADGKIVAVGWQYFNNSSNYTTNGTLMLITRLNANGTLDTSFNGNGIKTIEINRKDYANAVTVQADGKIIVGGYTENGSITEAIIARLNTDGSLDTSFDTDGIKSIATGNNYDKINDIALQTDGKIIASGQNATSSNVDFMTIRLNSNGSFDTSFNATGVVLTSFSTSYELATCLLIQQDNKILVGGYANTLISGNNSTNYAILRYNTDGSLDNSFSGDGKFTFGYPTKTDKLNSISITGSRIYLGGNSYVNSSYGNDFFIVAIRTDGTLDTSYSSGTGYSIHNSSSDDYGISLVNQNSYTYLYGYSDEKISYLKINSSIYSVTHQNKLKVDFGASKLVKKNGNLYFASMYYKDSGSNNDFHYFRNVCAKVNNNGVLYTNFGTNGYSGINNYSYLNGICVNNEGNIYTIGEETINKYLDNGNLDLTFGQNGILNVTSPYNPNNSLTICDDILIQNDNKVLLISDIYIGTNTNYINLLRYSNEGILDNSFGTAGQVYFTAGLGISGGIYTIIQPDQKILIGANVKISNSPSQYGIMMARLNNDGSFDSTFGNNGIQISPIPIGADGFITSIKTLYDGKILISKYAYNVGSYPNFTLAKYNSDGTLDTSFGTNGITITPIGISSSWINDFIVLNDNKIIAVGSSIINNRRILTLAKYTSSGTLDTTFANNGIFQDRPDGISIYDDNQIDLENNNKITVLASNFNGLNTNTTLVRYILDTNLGVLDFSETNNQSYIYPNPINEETNLVYTLNKETPITVELFDLQGKLVKTFFNNEIKSVGEHDEKLIIPNYLQAGNYILKISSRKGSNSIKLIKK